MPHILNRTRGDPGGVLARDRRPREGGRELDRLAWERTMKRLRASTRALAAILVALAARMIVFGATALAALVAAILALLTLASVLLTRQGRQLEPSRTRQARSGRR